MIFERESRKSRENSAVKYNPYKDKNRRKISLRKSDINLLNSKQENINNNKSDLFEARRYSKASKKSAQTGKRMKSKKSTSKRESERKITKSKDVSKKGDGVFEGKFGNSKNEFFTSLSNISGGFLGFKRKPSLDVEKLAMEKAKNQEVQGIFERKGSLAFDDQKSKI